MGYIERYNREHYRRVWIRRSTFNKLLELCDKPIVDCVDEIVEAVTLPTRMFEELRNYIISKSNEAKHIRYAGGDWYIRDELVRIAALVPIKRATFVEVFGGSGVLSQLVPRSKFPNVVYNDIDKDLVALHRLVKENPDLLASILSMLPYSRYINRYLVENVAGRELGGLVGASVLFYLLSSGFSGIVGAGFSTSKVAKSGSANRYISHVAALYEAAKRFRDVVIECLDFEELIEKYDSESTLFYMDPPYLSVREKDRDMYRHGFTPVDVARLANALKRLKGYFMLKVHEDNEAFYRSAPVIGRVVIAKKLAMSMAQGEERGELRYVVLTNYKLPPSLTGISPGKTK
ncbi:MAG: DNA adenine methylase [Thermofilaceae archaeon]